MATQACAAADLLGEGIARHKDGDLNQAARIYRRVLTADPRQPDALHLLGVIAQQQGEHESAISHIRMALALNGRSAAYHSNLGVACRSLGRLPEAIAALRRAVELEPTSAGIQYNLANALKDAGFLDEAADAYRTALAIDSSDPSAWTGLGETLRLSGDWEASIGAHQRAIELSPKSAEAHFNLGLAVQAQGRFAEAARCFLRAVSLQPDYVDAHLSLANLYEDQGQFARALAGYDRVLRFRPHLASAEFNRALALLRRGDLAAGWGAYESRWRHNGKRRVFAEPEWDPANGPVGTLLVHSEQGIGDEIMFASCFREAIERSRQCVIECEARLVRLFSRSFPSARFVPRAGEMDPRDAHSLPACDAQIAAGSLPRRLRCTFDSFPRHAGYLAADPDRTAEWRDRYDRLGAAFVVGISWQGGKDPAIRKRRSTKLEDWLPLFRVPGAAFVNLQYGDCAAEIECCRTRFGATVHHWDDSDPLRDLDVFAAQVAATDLVISVDNATVHLAGALGHPVWTLLSSAGDWRWFTGREDSPWYPSMRLFRQTAAEAGAAERWARVFERTAAELADAVRARGADELRRGAQFQDKKRMPEAIRCYQKAAASRPDQADPLNHLGTAWKECGRLDLACAAYAHAVEHHPQFAPAWFNLGNVHREENRLQAAVDCYERARRLFPGKREVLVNLSVALRELRRLDESLACLDEVLAQTPDLPQARFDRALVRLLRGDFAGGWDEYEWRLVQEAGQPATCPARWDGTPLAGRRLLIRAEQGLGDQVMFASCVPQVAAGAERCILECDPRLVPLFSRSFPEITPVSSGDAKPEAGELVEYVGSLPRFVRRRIEDFPKTCGYLVPDRRLVEQWRSRLARCGRALKVGIAWRGGKDAETQKKRSIPLDQWGCVLTVPGVRFVNLQHGSAAQEAAAAQARFGIALDDGTDCDPLSDLDNFAAKLAAVDLVISVDNSTVHLAGALGRPVWTLLPFSCDWRWGLDGETTPWYPGMRLFRNRSLDDWTAVLNRAGRELASIAFSGAMRYVAP